MSTERKPHLQWRLALETLATIAFIAVSATFVWSVLSERRVVPPAAVRAAGQQAKRVEPPLPSEPISIEGAALRGSKSAKVALIEYSDFQCPFCGKFAREILPELEKKYVTAGKIVMAFRQFPLPNHQFAQKAAEAAECAGRQNKFWPMHDAMFQNQKEISEVALRQSALTLGLDAKRFDVCLSGETSEQVKRDATEGRSLNVSGTPTFLFGYVQPDGRVRIVKRFSGAQPAAQFQATLDPLLAAAGPSTK